MLDGACHCPVAATIPAIRAKMISVRISVARSALMPATPIFAKIAVNAAKTADRIAQNCQLAIAPLMSLLTALGDILGHRAHDLEHHADSGIGGKA